MAAMFLPDQARGHHKHYLNQTNKPFGFLISEEQIFKVAVNQNSEFTMTTMFQQHQDKMKIFCRGSNIHQAIKVKF